MTIGAISLVAGGSAVHVTVDQASVPQSPFSISWTLDGVLSPVSVTPDSTGFNFQAPAGMPPCQANAVALNANGGGVGTLIVTVTTAALTFTSP